MEPEEKQALIAGHTNQLILLAECQNESHHKNVSLVAGFISAEPPKPAQARSLSGAEGNVDDKSNVDQSELEEGTVDSNDLSDDVR